jgi:hypothetical protein
MLKLDLTKEYKSYYSAKNQPGIVTVQKAHYISIAGVGDPNGADFATKIEALYPVAYAIKFAYKALNKDFVVAKLEALWSFDMEKYKGLTIDAAPTKIPRDEWNYRLLIRMPSFVSFELFGAAVKAVCAKKKNELVLEVEFFVLDEGLCVQMMHLGSFETEPQTLKQIGNFMAQNNLHHNGLHHEIYLSDFRKTPKEKLKTILREPIKI